MSLTTRERRALTSIEDRLCGSDPKLASLLATFTRLTCGEKMPVREKIAARDRLRGACRSQRGRHPLLDRACRRARKPSQRQACLLLWLVMAIGLVAIALSVSHGGGHDACAGTWVAACAGRAPTHSGRKPHRQSGSALPGPAGLRPPAAVLSVLALEPVRDLGRCPANRPGHAMGRAGLERGFVEHVADHLQGDTVAVRRSLA